MKKVVVGILCLFVHLPVYADSSKREKVEELMEVTQVESMMVSMYQQMDQMFVGMGQQLGIKPSEEDIFDNFMLKISEVMKTEMSWQKMEGPMIDLYLKIYTEKEIDDMLIFYRSETGRSMIEKMPAVLSESVIISQEMMQSFMPKVMEFSQEMEEELYARRSQE